MAAVTDSTSVLIDTVTFEQSRQVTNSGASDIEVSTDCAFRWGYGIRIGPSDTEPVVLHRREKLFVRAAPGESSTATVSAAPPDPGAPASGGLELSFGPSQSYTVVPEDATGADSWYGSGATATLVLLWTPTVSGSMYLPAVVDESGDFDVYLWKGGEEGVDFPNLVDNFTGANHYVNPGTPVRISAGQPYALIVVNWSATPGAVLDLDPIYSALGGWGGIADPPEPPADMPVVIARLPDGRAVARILSPGDAGEGNLSHAEGSQTAATDYGAHAEGLSTVAGYGSHTEGGNTVARNYGHAEGLDTQATGTAGHAEGELSHATAEGSHAEGISTRATGRGSHTEGEWTGAFGEASHAEGYQSRIGGDASYSALGAHAQGIAARAWRYGEDARGGGQFLLDVPIQVSRFLMGNETTDAAAANLVLDHGFGDVNNLLQLARGLTLVKGVIAASNLAATKCAAWEFMLFANSIAEAPVGVPVLTKVLDEDAAAWTVNPAQQLGIYVAISVVGEVGETVRWVAQLELTEVRCDT